MKIHQDENTPGTVTLLEEGNPWEEDDEEEEDEEDEDR